MRRFAKFALAGAAAAAIAGTGYAATNKAHVMDVALPGGAVAHIQYYGDIAPQVTIVTRPLALPGMLLPMAFPQFGDIDRMIAQMNQQTEAMIRQAQTMAAQPVAPGMDVASYGNMPAGANNVNVVSYSSGGRTCTRTTQIISQGTGKPPKVTTNVSGDCGSAPAPEAKPSAVANNPTQPLDHT